MARGQLPADIILANGRVVNVFNGEIESANVALCCGRIAGIGDYHEAKEVIDLDPKYPSPYFGLAMSHWHDVMKRWTISPKESLSLMKESIDKGIELDESAVEGVRALAFYHDINSLYLTRRLRNPFIIILINNGGGAIFEMLPIAKEKIEFEDYFKTPVNLDFGNIGISFGLNYHKIKSWADLKTQYGKAINSQSPAILEIRSNSGQSLELRRKFREASKTTVKKIINANKI